MIKMKPRWKAYFADVCIRTAQLSYAEKLKVGAIAVRDNRVIATGYNGRLPGEPNECEYEQELPDGTVKLTTRNDVEHAERNLIYYAAREGIKLKDSSLFITHAPCIVCARAIINAGFKSIYFLNNFNEPEAILLLNIHNVYWERVHYDINQSI
jgi:dCMP deaminase